MLDLPRHTCGNKNTSSFPPRSCCLFCLRISRNVPLFTNTVFCDNLYLSCRLTSASLFAFCPTTPAKVPPFVLRKRTHYCTVLSLHKLRLWSSELSFLLLFSSPLCSLTTATSILYAAVLCQWFLIFLHSFCFVAMMHQCTVTLLLGILHCYWRTSCVSFLG